MFAVDPSVKDDWLKFEDEVWMPWLQQQPGFVRKEIITSPGICVNNIWWKNKELLAQAAAKTNEMTAKDLEMRRRFGSKVIRLSASR
jgi:hypothetical protein